MKPATRPANITMQQAAKAVRAYLRGKPYTETGLKRVACAHCGASSAAQWSLRPCAIGKTGWYPLCTGCDVELNRLVMEFLRVPDAAERLAAYVASRTLPFPTTPTPA